MLEGAGTLLLMASGILSLATASARALGAQGADRPVTALQIARWCTPGAHAKQDAEAPGLWCNLRARPSQVGRLYWQSLWDNPRREAHPFPDSALMHQARVADLRDDRLPAAAPVTFFRGATTLSTDEQRRQLARLAERALALQLQFPTADVEITIRTDSVAASKAVNNAVAAARREYLETQLILLQPTLDLHRLKFRTDVPDTAISPAEYAAAVRRDPERAVARSALNRSGGAALRHVDPTSQTAVPSTSPDQTSAVELLSQFTGFPTELATGLATAVVNRARSDLQRSVRRRVQERVCLSDVKNWLPQTCGLLTDIGNWPAVSSSLLQQSIQQDVDEQLIKRAAGRLLPADSSSMVIVLRHALLAAQGASYVETLTNLKRTLGVAQPKLDTLLDLSIRTINDASTEFPPWRATPGDAVVAALINAHRCETAACKMIQKAPADYAEFIWTAAGALVRDADGVRRDTVPAVRFATFGYLTLTALSEAHLAADPRLLMLGQALLANDRLKAMLSLVSAYQESIPTSLRFAVELAAADEQRMLDLLEEHGGFKVGTESRWRDSTRWRVLLAATPGLISYVDRLAISSKPIGLAPTLPIGVDIGRRVGQRTYVGATFSPIDLGAIGALVLAGEQSDSTVTRWSQVVAPSATLRIGWRNLLPILFDVGVQWRRTADDTRSVAVFRSGIAVDVPLWIIR